MGYLALREVSSALEFLVDEESGRDLVQAELAGNNHWLVSFIAWFGDSVAGAHTNMQKARTNDQNILIPSVLIIGKRI